MFTIMYNLPVNSSITVASWMKEAGNYVKHPWCHQIGMKDSSGALPQNTLTI